MRLLIVISILCFSFTHGSQSPYGNNPPQYYNSNQDNYNPQQSQQGQQGYQQQQYPPQQQQQQQQHHHQSQQQPAPHGIPSQSAGPSYNQYGPPPRPGPPGGPPGYGQLSPYGRGELRVINIVIVNNTHSLCITYILYRSPTAA